MPCQVLNRLQKSDGGRTLNQHQKNNSIIISRNNELNQALPGVFWPFDLGSVLIARVRKKQFLFSTTYRYGFRNLFASNSSNIGNYHHSAFSISVGYVLLQIK